MKYLVVILIAAFIGDAKAELKDLGVHGPVESTVEYKAKLKASGKKKPTRKKDKITKATIQNLTDPKSFIKSQLPIRSSGVRASTAPLNKKIKIQKAAKFCILGYDEISKEWARTHKEKINRDATICYIVNVSTMNQIEEMEALVGKIIFPLDLDAKNIAVNIAQYPAVISNGKIYNYEK